MKYLRVRNWDKFQHYGKRSPPWIKLHRETLDDYEFSTLPDADKGRLMMIWLLASQCDNKLPDDPAWIRGKLGVDTEPDLQLYIELGFLEVIE